MAVSPLLPIGNLPVVEDSYVKGGYHTVADATARDAIPTERRRAGMQVWVEADQLSYRLSAGLGNGDWQTVSLFVESIEVHLSASGNDANDGLSAGQPVATWVRAWSIAENSANVTVHLVGAVTGYIPPPDTVRWLTITGGDNFTVIATGVAGASTNANQVELAVAAAVDAYQHFTIEFTDGDAAGYRRTIQGNTATIVTPVHPFQRHSAAVVPAPGDTYRIVRPSAILSGLAVVVPPEGNFYRTFQLSNALAPTRIDLINVGVTLDNYYASVYSTHCRAAATGSWFGVLFEFLGFLDAGSGRIIAGAEDRATGPDAYVLINEKLGLSSHILGEWHGWGLGFEFGTPGFSSGILANVQTDFGGDFYGFVTCGYLAPRRCTLLGGRSGQIFLDTGADCTITQRAINNDGLGANQPAVPFFAQATNSVIYIRNGARMIVHGPNSPATVSLRLKLTGNGNITGLIDVTNGSFFKSTACIEIDYGGANPQPVFLASGGSVVEYVPSYATPPVWAMNTGGLVKVSGNSNATVATFNLTGNFLAKNDGGTIELTKLGAFTPTAVVTTTLVQQTAGQSIVLGAVNLTGLTAATTGVVDISGGTFTQTAGIMTVTNSATGSNTVLRVRSGGQATLLGAANTVLNGSAGSNGYGISARGGGRVFFVAQPSSCTGATADLTVGTGGGEDQPDTFLSASESALVSGSTLSSIARST